MDITKYIKEKMNNTAPTIIKKISKKDIKIWTDKFKKEDGVEIDLTELDEKINGVVVIACGYNLSEVDLKKNEMTISPYYYFSNIYYKRINQIIDELVDKGINLKKLKKIKLKPLANMSGIGFFGKNTIIHNDKFGSQMFLYAFAVKDYKLDWDSINYELSDCGECKECIDKCPNNALNDYKIIREKCIRNYTLEGKYIPVELRDSLDKKLIGCDICQLACPKNKNINDDLDKMNINNREIIDPELYIKNWDKGLKNYIEELSLLIGSNYARTNRVLAQSIISYGNTGKTNLLKELEKLKLHQDEYIRDYSQWVIKKINERD